MVPHDQDHQPNSSLGHHLDVGTFPFFWLLGVFLRSRNPQRFSELAHLRFITEEIDVSVLWAFGFHQHRMATHPRQLFGIARSVTPRERATVDPIVSIRTR